MRSKTHADFRHNFGSLLFQIGKFKPDLILTSSAGFGSLSYPGAHAGENFKTMEQGYYESGLILAKIVSIRSNTLGIGSFYRYGPYSLEKTTDNLAVKVNLGITF